MGARKVVGSRVPIERTDRPALTAEQRENQIISKAYDLAEERINNGTASPSEIVHFLKLGSKKEKLERIQLEEEIKLLKAKTTAIENDRNSGLLYEEAIKAVRSYGGNPDD